MTLVELHVDLSRTADALERIAFLLEQLAFPPKAQAAPVIQATVDDLHTVSPEDYASMRAEQMAFAERYRVVPGSEAFARELAAWEQEQRSLHGEAWQAPDWAAVFAATQGPVREPADQPAVPAGERQ